MLLSIIFMKNFKKQGFTLIEILMYVALSSVILLAVTGFFQISLSSRVKTKTIAEVEQQAIQILNLIGQYTVNAQGINSPSVGSKSTSLSLDMPGTNIDPTIFSLNSGDIFISEGVSAATVLNSSYVEVSDLQFENLSKAGSNGLVRVELTLSYINNANRPEFSWSKTFYTSISLRQ